MPISITDEEKKILRSVTIPPRPEALLKFSQEAKQAEPNIKVIAEAIHSDVGISAAILQVVNSAAFRRAKEIESIDQAVMVLGLKRLIPLVKAVALKSSVGSDAALNDFWQAQTLIATASSLIANELNKPELANHSYMLGLFHSAGVPILFQHFSDYSDVLSLADNSGWDACIEFEYDRYHTSHTTIGALLAQQWALPKAMIDVIYYQHDVSGIFNSGELDKTGLFLLSILKTARHCAHVQQYQEKADVEWINVKEQICDYLNLEDPDLEDLKDSILARL